MVKVVWDDGPREGGKGWGERVGLGGTDRFVYKKWIGDWRGKVGRVGPCKIGDASLFYGHGRK